MQFLILACDGLWDEISDLDSVQIVRGHLAKFSGDWEGACNRYAVKCSEV
jgi:serine/threonine protein phosphatase PrpC